MTDEAVIALELQLGACLRDCEGLTRMARSGLRFTPICTGEMGCRLVRERCPQEKTSGGSNDQGNQNGLAQHRILL